MTVEIERKFLLRAFPDLSSTARKPIRQGYISQTGDSADVRLRQMGDGYFLTCKRGDGLVRDEFETRITAEQFDALWPATLGRRIEKTRYVGTLADGTQFELDVFEAALRPLALVEVEFSSAEAAQAFMPPDWFGDEVTDDPKYRNRALALARPE